jgi:hypothetical protein
MSNFVDACTPFSFFVSTSSSALTENGAVLGKDATRGFRGATCDANASTVNGCAGTLKPASNEMNDNIIIQQSLLLK